MKMANKKSSLWDSKAHQALQIEPEKWLNYYLGNSYRRAAKIGVNYQKQEHLRLLKTDLWNEGIRTQRTVLDDWQDSQQVNLYGIDISPLTCRLAREKNKKINVIQANISGLPFKNSFFDAVLDLSTLDHLPENEIRGVIREYGRVLVKDGRLVLVFWYPSILQRLVSRLGKAWGQPAEPTQYYLPINSVKSEAKREFDVLEEFCLGSLLNIHNRISDPIFKNLPEFIYNLILKVEYSRASKYLFKGFAGLYAIILRKR